MKQFSPVLVFLYGSLLWGADQGMPRAKRVLTAAQQELAATVAQGSQMRSLTDPSKLQLALDCLCDCSVESLKGKADEIEKLSNIIKRSQVLLAGSCRILLRSIAEKERQIIHSRDRDYAVLVKGMTALGRKYKGKLGHEPAANEDLP